MRSMVVWKALRDQRLRSLHDVEAVAQPGHRLDLDSGSGEPPAQPPDELLQVAGLWVNRVPGQAVDQHARRHEATDRFMLALVLRCLSRELLEQRKLHRSEPDLQPLTNHHYPARRNRVHDQVELADLGRGPRCGLKNCMLWREPRL